MCNQMEMSDIIPVLSINIMGDYYIRNHGFFDMFILVLSSFENSMLSKV